MQAVTGGTLVFLVPGPLTEHNRAEAQAGTGLGAVRGVEGGADVGTVPTEAEVTDSVRGRLQADVQPTRNLIRVHAKHVRIRPPSRADDGAGGIWERNLKIPPLCGTPRALVGGFGESGLKVEGLVLRRVGGSGRADCWQAVAVSAVHRRGGVCGHRTMADVGVKVHLVMADGAWRHRRAGRAGCEELGGSSGGRRGNWRRLVRQGASEHARCCIMMPGALTTPGCGIMCRRCRRRGCVQWRLRDIIFRGGGVGPTRGPQSARDAAAGRLQAGHYVRGQVKQAVHKDIVADIRGKANARQIQGGQGKGGLLVLGLTDSTPGADEFGMAR